MRTLMLQAVALLVVFVTGCVWQPDAVPRFSPCGKQVAFLAVGEGDLSKASTVGIATLRSGKIDLIRLPDGVAARGMVWAKGKLLVQCDRDPMHPESEDNVYAWADAKRGALVRREKDEFVEYVNRIDRGLKAPEMEMLTSPATPRLLARGHHPSLLHAAGGGGLVAQEYGGLSREDARSLAGMDWDDVAGGQSATLTLRLYAKCGTELGAISDMAIGEHSNVFPMVRLSRDLKKVSLLRITTGDGEDVNIVEIRDVRSGALDWSLRNTPGGPGYSFTGIPAFDGASITFVEAFDDDSKAPVLVRHTKEGRQELLTIENATKGGHSVLYAPSEDGKRMVLQVPGESPRLMIVPMKGTPSAGDIQLIPYADTEPVASE